MASTKRDRIFMEMCYSIARLSKDESTHIGAVIVGPDHEIRSTGYNSFPRGLDDNRPERQIRPEKYFWFEHAERNAIFNAARVGIPLKGCRIYTNGTPCMDCGRAIIQAGIIEVIIDQAWEDIFVAIAGEKWQEDLTRTKEMFAECGISMRAIVNLHTMVPKFLRGRWLDLDKPLRSLIEEFAE